MKLTNITDQTIDLPTLGVSVEPGGPVEVSGETAAALIAQGSFRRTGNAGNTTNTKAKAKAAAPATDSKDV